MPVNDTTANRAYQKPNIANTLADDVGRLRSALDSIDTDMVSKAPTAGPTFTGVTTVAAGSAAAPSLTFTGATGDTGLYSPGADLMAISTAGTERFYVSEVGNVGIGTRPPSAYLLQVRKDQDTYTPIVITNASTGSNAIASLVFSNNVTFGTSVNYYGSNHAKSNFLELFQASAAPITFNIQNNERARIDSSGRVGIGTTSPTSLLTVAGAANLLDLRLPATSGFITYDVNASDTGGAGTGSCIFRRGAGPEVARIDSSGRLLVGTSAARTNFSIGGTAYAPQTQLEGGVLQASFVRAVSPYIGLAASNTVAANDSVGNVSFFGSDGTNFIRAAEISAAVDGTPGANDMPGRLVFSTTADGAASPTERLRITSTGKLLVGASAGFTFTTSSTNTGISQQQLVGVNTTDETASLAIVHCNQGGATRGPSLVLAKNRGATTALGTVQNNENFGEIVFQGSASSAFVRGASIVAFQDGGTPSSTSMAGRLVFFTTADGAASPTEAMRINNQRELLIGTTTRTANGGVLQISNGITFPGTQSACSDANTLDDYEEGTFTPTVTAGITSPTYNTGSTRGTYRKIGALVYFTLRVTLTAGTTSATTLQIGGLPFAIAASIEYRVAFHGNFQVGASTASVTAVGYNSVSYMDILNSGSGAVISGTTATNTMDLQITGSYPV